MLGDPVEVYYYGIRYVLFVASIAPMVVAVAYLYVPVFCKLKLTSAYQAGIRYHVVGIFEMFR